MSVYAFDVEQGRIVVSWMAATGWRSTTVVDLGVRCDAAVAARVSRDLTLLSEALWHTYVRPVSAAVSEREFSEREDAGRRVRDAAGMVRRPNLPHPSGALQVSYVPIEFYAHRLGRLLHEIGDPRWTDAISGDVAVEADAVGRAELGDLSGRAVQVVGLDRLDASPVQVEHADAILRDDPLNGGLAGAEVDPAAACVAAAHWLAAAAVVAAQTAGGLPHQVFVRADDIHVCSVGVPTMVVERIYTNGISPRDVVVDLLRVAVAVGDGVVADLDGVVAERERLLQTMADYTTEQKTAGLAALPARATPLDPRRPARDLLEHLLDGIASCHLLYAEYALHEDFDLDDSDDEDADDQDLDDADADRLRRKEVAEEFAELLRDEAEVTKSRLG